MAVRNPVPRQAGFSLVELMVALVLGLILTSGVISVYITSKNTYNVNNGLGAVQEHGRFAFSFMDPHIRMAGYHGCARKQTPNNNSGTGADPVYDYSTGVYGYEAKGTGIGDSLTLDEATASTVLGDPASWTPALDAGGAGTLYANIKDKIVADSDVFMVRELAGAPYPLVGAFDDKTSLFVSTTDKASDGVTDVNDSEFFTVGEIAMVANCSQQPQVFTVTAVDTAAGSITYDALGVTFDSGGNVGAALTYAYFVGQGVDGGPALYEAYLDSAGQLQKRELVSGIENMQVLYGVGDGSDAPVTVNFQTADTIDAAGAWNKVVSIRVALIARSDDNAVEKAPVDAPVFHMLASDPVADKNGDGFELTLPQDRRLRRYFVQTFSVRNALP
ncbi:MAG TPA: PilW family protein [Gammaproteobacteria bacterium]|jgi:type IV pilus assembly protein PilW|nr:PilW family protein [Gammaproteobacteria bacterium]